MNQAHEQAAVLTVAILVAIAAGSGAAAIEHAALSGLKRLLIRRAVAEAFVGGLGGGRGCASSADCAARIVPNIGTKLEYFIGRATGKQHNIERSQSKLRQLQRVGIQDTPATRLYLQDHLTEVANTSLNVVMIHSEMVGRHKSHCFWVRERAHVRDHMDGASLITGNIFGRP